MIFEVKLFIRFVRQAYDVFRETSCTRGMDMNFFYILSGRRIKQGLIILVASFFAAAIFYFENDLTTSVFKTEDGPRAIYQGERAGKKVALTFDITWGDTKALPIIDLLKKNGKKATFFLSASWAESHPDIVKRIVDDGHEIGLKGYSYVNYTELEDAKIKKDIYQAQSAFKKMGVKTANLLRAPDGNIDNRVIKVADAIGLTLVHWSVDSNDWQNPGVEVISNNVVKEVKGGDIVLFHASDSAKQTASALPTILQDMKRKGLSFVTVSELISNSDVKTNTIN